MASPITRVPEMVLEWFPTQEALWALGRRHPDDPVPRQNSILGRAGILSSTVGANHTPVVLDRAKRRTALSRAIEVKQSVEDRAEATSFRCFEKYQDGWVNGSGYAIVSMMQTTQRRHRNDLAVGVGSPNHRSACRRILRQPEVGPIHVVMENTFGHQTLQLSLVEKSGAGQFDQGHFSS